MSAKLTVFFENKENTRNYFPPLIIPSEEAIHTTIKNQRIEKVKFLEHIYECYIQNGFDFGDMSMSAACIIRL